MFIEAIGFLLVMTSDRNKSIIKMHCGKKSLGFTQISARNVESATCMREDVYE
jgi:hypothetical protein